VTIGKSFIRMKERCDMLFADRDLFMGRTCYTEPMFARNEKMELMILCARIGYNP